jgi:hypothetical protein
MPALPFVSWAVAAMAYLLAAAAVGDLLRRTYPHPTLGLCNVVTLGRLVIVGVLTAALVAGGGAPGAVFALAALALALDGVDGWLARRHGRVSGFGARFDMEVDSAFALVLALHALVSGTAGPARPRPRAHPLRLRRGEPRLALARRAAPGTLQPQGGLRRSARGAHPPPACRACPTGRRGRTPLGRGGRPHLVLRNGHPAPPAGAAMTMQRSRA